MKSASTTSGSDLFDQTVGVASTLENSMEQGKFLTWMDTLVCHALSFVIPWFVGPIFTTINNKRHYNIYFCTLYIICIISTVFATMDGTYFDEFTNYKVSYRSIINQLET
jgi:hypothetical protein